MSKRICAWCDKPMGNGNGADNTETHGICKKCIVLYFSESILHILSGSVGLEGQSEILHSESRGRRRFNTKTA